VFKILKLNYMPQYKSKLNLKIKIKWKWRKRKWRL